MSENFRVSELDFDQIKENLKTYLRTQEAFTDYDFEGSNLSAILNVLAYNTHYNAVLTNAAFNETFLDTAIKRGSVVSRASELGYVPKSAKSAKATIAVDIQNIILQTPVVSIPEFYEFRSKIGDSNYSFFTLKSYSASADTGFSYTFPAIDVYEGKKLVFNFVANGDVNQKFRIPNQGIDTSTMRVTVRSAANSTTVVRYLPFVDLIDQTADSTVYYLEENSEGFYQIFFGDGVLSKNLSVNNIVTIDYIIPSGFVTNTSSLFTQRFTTTSALVDVDGNPVVRTIANSIGYGEKEGVEEIRFNSRLSFERQNRVITENDFYSHIYDNFSGIDSVSVYGGENETPPVYGKIYVALKPNNGFSVSQNLKNAIQTSLRGVTTMNVYPEFKDPDYTYLNLDISYKVNYDVTTLTETEIRNNVQASINSYLTTEIGKFKKSFYYSKLTKTIDETDPSIISSFVSIKLQKRFSPITGQLFYGIGDYSVSLTPGSLESNFFTINSAGVLFSVRLIDDGLGNIKYQDIVTKNIFDELIGTVNYDTGRVILNNLILNSYLGNEVFVKLNAIPLLRNTDITPTKNQILVIDDSTRNDAAGVKTGLTLNAV